jgi:hypothetical protein
MGVTTQAKRRGFHELVDGDWIATVHAQEDDMSRNHLVAIGVGLLLLVILWFLVVPLLLDLGEKNGPDAALGWLVLIGATLIVGWIMFRPPGFQAEVGASRIRKRRGLRRSQDERRRRDQPNR